MGSSVSFFAGPNDDHELCGKIVSLGLIMVPPSIDQLAKVDFGDPARQFWFLSVVEIDDLHPYGTPRTKLGDATDPLIEFMRSYYDPPNLIAGRIYWSDDVPELAEQTKPYYSKLARWIRKEWFRRETGFYVGPQAQELIREGAKTLNFPPSLKITTKTSR